MGGASLLVKCAFSRPVDSQGSFGLTLGSVLRPLGASVGRLFGPLEAKLSGERAKWGPSGIRPGQSRPESARVGQNWPGLSQRRLVCAIQM